MKRILLLIIVSSLILFSCQKVPNPVFSYNKIYPFVFPTNIGHKWKYSFYYESRYGLLNPISYDYYQWGFRTWEIISMNTINGNPSYTIKSVQSDSVRYIRYVAFGSPPFDTTYTVDSVETFQMIINKDSTIVQWNNILKEKYSPDRPDYLENIPSNLYKIPNKTMGKIDTLKIAAIDGMTHSYYKNGTGLISYYIGVPAMSGEYSIELNLISNN